MLLTTPSSLSFLEESSLRTNNSSSHIILLALIFTTPFLFLSHSFSPPHPHVPSLSPIPLTFFTLLSALLSPFSVLCPSSPPQSTLSLSSQCCIDFHKAPPVISPYLLIHTLTPSLATLQGCFHFRTHIHNLSLSLYHFLHLQLSL